MRGFGRSIGGGMLVAIGLFLAGPQTSDAQPVQPAPMQHVERWQRPAEPIDRMLHVGDLAATDDDTVYVLDTFGCRVVHVDPESGDVIDAWGSCGTDLGQLDRPTAITWNPAGKVYVAERTLGRVQVFDARGQWLDWFDARVIECPARPERCAPRPFTGLVGIHARDDGTLFGLEQRSYLAVFAIAPEGTVTVRRPPGFQPTLRTGGFVADDQDRVFFLDQYGNVMSAQPGGRVFRFSGMNRWQVRLADLALTGDGDVCVGYRSRLDCFRPDGSQVVHRGLNPIRSLAALTAGADDRLYVADRLVRSAITGALGASSEVGTTALHRVQGDLVTPLWGRPASLDDWPLVTGRPHVSFRMSIGTDGTVTTFDMGGHTGILPEAGAPYDLYDVPPRITRIDPIGSQLVHWGERGTADGAFGPTLPQLTSGSTGATTGPDGTVYAADPYNGRIQAFTPQGRWLRSIPTSAELPWPSRDGIVDLAIDDGGTLFALDIHPQGEGADSDSTQPSQIRRFDPRGDEESPIDLAEPGLIIDPDFDVAPDGRSFFLSTRGSRAAACRLVQRIALGGTPLMSFGLGTDHFGGCGGPLIAADRNGVVSVLRDDMLERYSADGRRTDRVGLPSILGEGARALAVGQDGRVLVATSQGPRRAWPAFDRPFVIDTFAKTHASEWRVELYPGPHLAGPRLAALRVETVDATWLDRFDATLNDREAETYSARFERRNRLRPGRHQVQLSAGGGARLWAAGRLLIDRWQADAVTETASFFTPGTRSTVLRLEVRGPDPDIRNLELDLRHAGPLSIHRRFLPIVRGSLK